MRGAWLWSRDITGGVEQRGEPCRNRRVTECVSYEGVEGSVAVKNLGRVTTEDEGGSVVICDKVDQALEFRWKVARRRGH